MKRFLDSRAKYSSRCYRRGWLEVSLAAVLLLIAGNIRSMDEGRGGDDGHDT